MTPPQTSELLNCPFCGEHPNIKPYQSGFSLQHHCSGGMYIGLWGFWSDIEKHWNHRTPSPREVELEVQKEDLEQQLERARTYRGTEGWPCPLCRYDNGVFKESCEMHKRIDRLEKQLAKARTPLKGQIQELKELYLQTLSTKAQP
jgi:hypothetical protein